MKVFSGTYHEDWKEIVERFGLFGGKRRYTVATYFSNTLDMYSQKPHSILVQFKGYKKGKFTDYRKTTKEERKAFGSPWITVYKKKTTNKH
jgi:hypothetical protein